MFIKKLFHKRKSNRNPQASKMNDGKNIEMLTLYKKIAYARKDIRTINRELKYIKNDKNNISQSFRYTLNYNDKDIVLNYYKARGFKVYLFVNRIEISW